MTGGLPGLPLFSGGGGSGLPEGGVWLAGPVSWVLDGPSPGRGPGETLMERITKYAGELGWVGIPFERRLGPASEITDVTAEALVGDVEVLTDPVIYSRTVAKVGVQGGTAGTVSRVRVTATANDGQVMVYEFEVGVRL